MHHRVVSLLTALFLVVAACGGSGDETTDVVTTPGQASVSTVSPTAVPTTVADTEPDSDDEMSPINCPELVAAVASAANAAAASMTGDPVTEGPAANMRELAERIPEIRDDLNIVADALDAFFGKLQEIGVDLGDPSSIAGLSPEQMEEVTAASEALDGDEVAEANANIEDFFERECS